MRSCPPFIHERLPGTGLLLAFALLAACAVKEAPPAPLADSALSPVSTPVPFPAVERAPSGVYRETGLAGWYGRELHGRKTASGELFDRHGLSAAHRTLPLGTIVHVTNLDNFKSITVRINDRGPFLRSRFLDLSYEAATELGFVAQGTARVRIETLAAVGGTAKYAVQAAVFTEEENARMLQERLDAKYEAVSIVPFETNLARSYRVLVGAYESEDRAEQTAGKLALEGLEALVVRKD